MAKPPRNALLRGLWPGLRMGQTAGIVERLRWRKHPPVAATMPLWCNWLTRRPLKAESPGSSPGNATKFLIYGVSNAVRARRWLSEALIILLGRLHEPFCFFGGRSSAPGLPREATRQSISHGSDGRA